MDGWALGPGFEADSAAAEAARRTFGARIMEEDRPQYLTVGLQLGERYEGSPIVWPDGTPAPPDAWDSLHAGRPAGRARAAFLARQGRAAVRRFGPGFTLLDFGAADAAGALETAARTRGVPLKTCGRRRRRALRSKLVLVRPDQHIAWHGDAAADAAAVIDQARGA